MKLSIFFVILLLDLHKQPGQCFVSTNRAFLSAATIASKPTATTISKSKASRIGNAHIYDQAGLSIVRARSILPHQHRYRFQQVRFAISVDSEVVVEDTTTTTTLQKEKNYNSYRIRQLRFARIEDTMTATTSQKGKDDVFTMEVKKDNGITNKTLEEYQKAARKIASTFVPKPFQPNFWLSNCHVQTILAVFLREVPECAYISNIGEAAQAVWNHYFDVMKKMKYDSVKDDSAKHTFWDKREKIVTQDNDWFHADYKFSRNNNDDEKNDNGFFGDLEDTIGGQDNNNKHRNSKGLAILLHGLESDARSPQSRDIADAHLSLGLDVVCLNFRGCSGTPNDKIGGYHLGYTDDLRFFLDRWVQQQREANPSADLPPVYLSGFSLGSNAMIKGLGELGQSAVDKYNIRGATALACPLDLEQTYWRLQEPGINAGIYSKKLLSSMRVRANDELRLHCNNDPNTDKFDYYGAMNAETIYDFEDAVICKIYGFDDPIDYYRKCSSVHYMDDVAVPFLILNSADDPLFNPNYWPIEKGVYPGSIGNSPCKMVRHENGGHCGFMFSQLSEDERRNIQENDGQDRPKNSWAPTEMARFVKHVMDNTDSL